MSEGRSLSTGTKSQSQVSRPAFHTLDVPPLPDDLIIGVRNITLRVMGTDDARAVRSMFNMLENSNTIPWFKLGSRTCVRMSSLRAKIWSQEKRAWARHDQELLVQTHILLSSLVPLLISFSETPEVGHVQQLVAISEEAIKTIAQLTTVAHK